MTRQTKILLLTTGTAAFILLGLAQAIIGPVLPVYASAFGLSVASVGWLVSLFWTGCLAAVIAVYLRPNLMGPKSGLALSVLGTGLMALMGSWGLVLLGAGIFGAGYGVIAAVYNPRVLAAFGPRGPAMMSLLNAIFTLGAIAAPQIFLGFGSDPSLTFWTFAAFSLLTMIAAAFMGDTRSAASETESARPVDPFILGFAACGIGMESSIVGLGPTALGILGKTPEEAAQLLSLFFIAYLFARLSLVFIAHRVAAFVLYGCSVGLLAALSLALALGAEPAWIFPFMGLACGPLFHGAYLTGLARMGATASVSALLLAAGIIGAIVLPMIIAQSLSSLGPTGFFQIIACIAGFVLVMVLGIKGRYLPRAD